MTKRIEPSNATLNAWFNALAAWTLKKYTKDNDSNITAARIIQYHVDREVRKALKGKDE